MNSPLSELVVVSEEVLSEVDCVCAASAAGCVAGWSVVLELQRANRQVNSAMVKTIAISFFTIILLHLFYLQ